MSLYKNYTNPHSPSCNSRSTERTGRMCSQPSSLTCRMEGVAAWESLKSMNFQPLPANGTLRIFRQLKSGAGHAPPKGTRVRLDRRWTGSIPNGRHRLLDRFHDQIPPVSDIQKNQNPSSKNNVHRFTESISAAGPPKKENSETLSRANSGRKRWSSNTSGWFGCKLIETPVPWWKFEARIPNHCQNPLEMW